MIHEAKPENTCQPISRQEPTVTSGAFHFWQSGRLDRNAPFSTFSIWDKCKHLSPQGFRGSLGICTNAHGRLIASLCRYRLGGGGGARRAGRGGAAGAM